jgi:hypothetical protein
LPQLKEGLTINVGFESIFDFEKTKEVHLFQTFHIPLCHGWCVDPQDEELYSIMVKQYGNYNKAVEAFAHVESTAELSPTSRPNDNDVHSGKSPESPSLLVKH